MSLKMQRGKNITSIEGRFIEDNPNVCSSVLSRLTGRGIRTVERYRRRIGAAPAWSYKGNGVPMLRFNAYASQPAYVIDWRGVRFYESKKFIDCANFSWWLGECINDGFFNMPRVEHPYFFGIDFGEKK